MCIEISYRPDPEVNVPFYLPVGIGCCKMNTLPVKRDKCVEFESWKDEEFCPGEPVLPIGAYMYNYNTVSIH